MKTSIEEIPEELWQAACAREAVIRPLAASPHVGRAEIEGAASALGIRRAYVYRLLAAYRRRPGVLADCPKRPHAPFTISHKLATVPHSNPGKIK